MRRGFDGLAALTTSVLGQDPLAGHLFFFFNRRRDRIKILHWDRDGYVVWAKHLERGVFRFPTPQGERVEVTPAEMAAIIEGIDLQYARGQRRFVRPSARPS
jgi:transposase